MNVPWDETRTVRTVVALHSRELKTALLVALNPISTVITVAFLPWTSELIGHRNATHLDIVIVEDGLSTGSLSEAVGTSRF